MTQSTEAQITWAQIKAVKKEYVNRCGHYNVPSDETFAALTAAAQGPDVAGEIIEIERELRKKAVAATIERCKRVVKETTETTAFWRDDILVALDKLKDEPPHADQ